MSITQAPSLAKKARTSNPLTIGFALFSMFFGAGNLIFPLLIGKSAGGGVWYAISGLGLTAVIIPFLGLAAMVLFQGDPQRFFGRIGKIPGVLLLLLLQLILGPFGVIPRLVTLMHAMSLPYLCNIPLGWFSILAAGILFGCSIKRRKLIGLLGVVLTPILLLSLAVLIFVGLTDGSSAGSATQSPSDSFFLGALGGYNTMDLIAAFLFATVVLPHFQKEEACCGAKPRSMLNKMFLSSAIAAMLLFLTYVGLCLLSAHHGSVLDEASAQEQMLGTLAGRLLGPAGGVIAAIAVITACLTTAITLASIFAEYLRKDLCKEKISSSCSLVLTLAAATLFANLGFGGIAAFLGPILQVVYPGLIGLTVLNLFHSLYGWNRVKLPVFFIFACSTILFIYTIYHK